MSVQVLVSTMNQVDIKSLVKDMRVKSAVVINQVTNNITVPKDIKSGSLTSFSVKERGLSRSRNLAIELSESNICLLADDDMIYSDNYEEIVSKGFKKYPEADIIAFYVDSDDERQQKEKLKEGKLSMITTMKIASWNITFRRKSIIDSAIKFDENYGTGTKNYMGEENIFLFDCYKKGLKIYYMPIKIASLRKDSISTWFMGYDKKYFYVKGKVYYRMSTLLSLALILQFAIRKKNIYDSQVGFWRATKYMIVGAYSKNIVKGR